jgi:hypothetical protein
MVPKKRGIHCDRQYSFQVTWIGQEGYDQRVLKKEAPAKSEELQQALKHGTENEPNVVATLLGTILPFYYPELQFYEVGSYTVAGKPTKLMLDSDGILSNGGPSEPTPSLACEFKCPVPQPYKTPVHYQVRAQATSAHSVPKGLLCLDGDILL